MLNIAKIVGDNVRRMRSERGWKGDYLAEKMETNPQNMSGIERGVRGLSIKQIEKMCEALGCEAYELFIPPDSTDGNLLKQQLMAEIKIMRKEDIAALCAYAVTINAQRGVKPE